MQHRPTDVQNGRDHRHLYTTSEKQDVSNKTGRTPNKIDTSQEEDPCREEYTQWMNLNLEYSNTFM